VTGLPTLDAASVIFLVGSAGILIGAGIYALVRRGRPGGTPPRTVMIRAATYVALAAMLLVAARTGVAGLAILFGLFGAAGVIEWGRMFDLPSHHRIALVIANCAIIAAVAIEGVTAAYWLVGGIVLVGAIWPVLRADTGRAIRDLGYAAVGLALISVMLAHGVALAVTFGPAGSSLVLALAVGCAFSDVGAFIAGKTLGRHPLAPRLSPNKKREGLIGNVVGAAAGIAFFAPILVPIYGGPFVVALVPLVAGGSVWGDLLESAAKREARVKDAGTWLPGFGGMLDRVDSLLITVALGYWIAVIWGAGAGA
jgi:phosphatidate cytidylyltransferase